MIYNISFAITLIMLSFICAARSGNIDAFLAEGLITTELVSLGGHEGKCLKLVVKNQSNELLTTRIESGRIMTSNDVDNQNILITKPQLIVLNPEVEATYELVGYCCQSQNSGPPPGSEYTMGPMADEQLMQIARYLDKHEDLSESVQQSAVWVASDCHPLSSVEQYNDATKGLSEFLSETLGIPQPWYSTVHRASVNQLFSARVDRLYGEIDFQVWEVERINVFVIDDRGRVVKKLLTSTIYGPGNYTYPIELRVEHWPPGEYMLRLETDQAREIASRTFTL